MCQEILAPTAQVAQLLPKAAQSGNLRLRASGGDRRLGYFEIRSDAALVEEQR